MKLSVLHRWFLLGYMVNYAEDQTLIYVAGYVQMINRYEISLLNN